MTLRYGLIGSGMMGQEHIRNLNLLEGCEVTAVADPDEGMRIRAYGDLTLYEARGEYQLVVGLYDPVTTARLPRLDSAGDAVRWPIVLNGSQ